MKSQLRKFFWHHSADCKNQILAKCLIGESSNLTARFRSSGHYEKQIGQKNSKNGSEKPKSHIRMTMVEIEYVVIMSPC